MVAKRHKITNVPLFKKLWDILFFFWDNNFVSPFSGHFEGASTFLTPKCPSLRSRNLRGQKSLGPLKMSLETAQKVIVPQKKNYVPQFLKQRDINSYYVLLPYIIYVMQSHRFSQSPAFLSRTAKERDKKNIVKSPQRYKK
jgi:hypothetical protein